MIKNFSPAQAQVINLVIRPNQPTKIPVRGTYIVFLSPTDKNIFFRARAGAEFDNIQLMDIKAAVPKAIWYTPEAPNYPDGIQYYELEFYSDEATEFVAQVLCGTGDVSLGVQIAGGNIDVVTKVSAAYIPHGYKQISTVSSANPYSSSGTVDANFDALVKSITLAVEVSAPAADGNLEIPNLLRGGTDIVDSFDQISQSLVVTSGVTATYYFRLTNINLFVLAGGTIGITGATSSLYNTNITIDIDYEKTRAV